jgi:hypothetical protein
MADRTQIITKHTNITTHSTVKNGSDNKFKLLGGSNVYTIIKLNTTNLSLVTQMYIKF